MKHLTKQQNDTGETKSLHLLNHHMPEKGLVKSYLESVKTNWRIVFHTTVKQSYRIKNLAILRSKGN